MEEFDEACCVHSKRYTVNRISDCCEVYLDNNPCCSCDSRTLYFADQRPNVALGQYETGEIFRTTVEQVCEPREESSKNFCYEA